MREYAQRSPGTRRKKEPARMAGFKGGQVRQAWLRKKRLNDNCCLAVKHSPTFAHADRDPVGALTKKKPAEAGPVGLLGISVSGSGSAVRPDHPGRLAGRPGRASASAGCHPADHPGRPAGRLGSVGHLRSVGRLGSGLPLGVLLGFRPTAVITTGKLQRSAPSCVDPATNFTTFRACADASLATTPGRKSMRCTR
jgi:hypothetical protein